MKNRLILYDFGPEDRPREGRQGEDFYFPAQPAVRRCLGCFGCWVRTPGRCVIQDRASILPERLANCDELIIVTPLLYGGYSACVKTAMERCLGYLLPYLRVVQGEMHHRLRYRRSFRLTACFYGPCTEEERWIAQRLPAANGLNLGAENCQALFFQNADQAKEAIGWNC